MEYHIAKHNELPRLILVSNFKKEGELQKFIDKISNMETGDWYKTYNNFSELYQLVLEGIPHLTKSISSVSTVVNHVPKGIYIPTPNVPETKLFDKQKLDKKLDQYDVLNNIDTKILVYNAVDELTNTFPDKTEDWNKDVRDGAKRILNTCIRELNNSEMMDRWLTSVRYLFDKADLETRLHYKSNLNISTVYENTVKKTPNMIRLMQTFNDFSYDIIRRLVADSIDKWTKEEFAVLMPKIDFSTVGKRNPKLLDDLESGIMMQMNSQKDDEKIRRLKELYGRIRSSSK